METPSKSFWRKGRSAEGITLLGLGMNVGLVGLKVGLGLALGSTALFADGIHSLSDLATDFITLGGLRLARKPPDESHAYGHGKFETLAGALVALALLGVGVFIVLQAVRILREGAMVRLGWAVPSQPAFPSSSRNGFTGLPWPWGRSCGAPPFWQTPGTTEAMPSLPFRF